MEFRGTITEIKEIKTGTTQAGKDWASVEFEVTESNAQNPEYPQIGLFSYFKIGDYKKYAEEFDKTYKLNDEVNVEFNLKCSTYTKDGEERKFYKTEAWRVTKIGSENANPIPPAEAFEPIAVGDLNEDDHDDLPF